MAVRIHCINKSGGNHDNPHESIHNFGWINESTGESGNSTLAEMVEFIDIQKGVAFVRSAQETVRCYTRQGRYTKFVQTYADNTPTDNLLRLPECVS